MSGDHVQSALDLIGGGDVHSVRVVFADQHGLFRGKSIAAGHLDAAFERGVGVPGSLLHKDTNDTYAVDLWKPTGDATLDSLVGARNIVLRPDPSTMRLLPWSDGTAIVLSDIETDDGRTIAHSTRGICADAGLELEYHLYAVGADGTLTHSHPGWDLLGEEALDRIDGAIEPIRRGLTEFGFAPTSIEAELGHSQIEMTFPPTVGLAVADQAMLVRSAIRHIARRTGHRATFMSRPGSTARAFPAAGTSTSRSRRSTTPAGRASSHRTASGVCSPTWAATTWPACWPTLPPRAC